MGPHEIERFCKTKDIVIRAKCSLQNGKRNRKVNRKAVARGSSQTQYTLRTGNLNDIWVPFSHCVAKFSRSDKDKDAVQRNSNSSLQLCGFMEIVRRIY